MVPQDKPRKIWTGFVIYSVHNILFLSRAYGSVYKAMLKESSEVLAIKQVPVDTDLQEIIKEISIMQQCDR